MHVSLACKLASILLGAALARMRSPYLVHDFSYESILRKRRIEARLRAHEMDAKSCHLARDDSFAPFGPSSPTISAVITAWRRAPGWKGIHASSRSSFPPERAGSICRRAGGDSSVAMRSPGKALPILRRLSKPLASRRRSSTCGPGPGSGDVHLRHLVVIGVSFVIGFNERSTSTASLVSLKQISLKPDGKLIALA